MQAELSAALESVGFYPPELKVSRGQLEEQLETLGIELMRLKKTANGTPQSSAAKPAVVPASAGASYTTNIATYHSLAGNDSSRMVSRDNSTSGFASHSGNFASAVKPQHQVVDMTGGSGSRHPASEDWGGDSAFDDSFRLAGDPSRASYGGSGEKSHSTATPYLTSRAGMGNNANISYDGWDNPPSTIARLANSSYMSSSSSAGGGYENSIAHASPADISYSDYGVSATGGTYNNYVSVGGSGGIGGGQSLDVPMCNCNKLCVVRTSRQEKSSGHQFYSCSIDRNSPGHCGFFAWADPDAVSANCAALSVASVEAMGVKNYMEEIRHRFGHRGFRQGQRECIEAALRGTATVSAR